MVILGTVLSALGAIGMLVFSIQILITAFKTSIGWGLASLLLPFASRRRSSDKLPAVKR